LASFDSASLAAAFRQILLWNAYQELRHLEGQCHGLIFSVLKAMSFSVLTQPSVSQGIFDILITLGTKVAYVCKIKYEKFTPIEGQDEEKARERIQALLNKAILDAKEQIMLKKYDEVYHAEYQIVKKMALAFVGQTDVAVEIY
jgi:hypothetical protein